jgi:hypothetical protein
VVFTQYDRLVMQKEYELRESEIPKTEDEILPLAKSMAQESFVENCVSRMTKVAGRIPCLGVSGGTHTYQFLRRYFLTCRFDSPTRF